MTIPTISTLPTAPARTDPPATFISRADAFLAALVTMQSELNTSIGAMNTDIAGVNTSVTLAQDWAAKNDDAVSGTDWSSFANASGASPTGSAKAWATTDAGVVVADGEYSAKSYAADSSTSATNAQAAQSAAEAASNATLWVSGTTYASGDVVYSPIDYLSYRANTATSGTTDPSASSDWTALAVSFPSQTGEAGKYLTTDGTNTSWGEISASPTHQATASGSLSDGDLVIVNSDGTVSSIEGNLAGVSNAVTWWSGTTGYYPSLAYDSDTGAFIMMALPGGGTSNPGYNVATISGNTVTVGTFSTLTTTQAGQGKVVYNELWDKVAFISQNGYSWGTVDAVNRTVTWQSVAGLPSYSFNSTTLNYDDVSGRMLQIGNPFNYRYTAMIYRSTDGVNMVKSSALDATTISSSGSVVHSTVNLGNSRFLTAAPMGTNLGLRSFITTITGNSTATFGSFQSVIGGVTIGYAGIAYASDINKALILFQDPSNSNYLSYKLGTVNAGSSVSWGATTVITPVASNAATAVYDSNSQKFVINSGSQDRSFYEGVYVSGNELSLTKTISNYTTVYPSDQNSIAHPLMDTANNKVIMSTNQKAVFYSAEATNLTENNFIGISNGSYADSETANIQIAGSVDDAQSGLTAGEKYYALVDGTLSTTAGIPEVVAGTSVSSSEIIVKG